MSSERVIEAIENNINRENINNEIEVNILLAGIPGSVEVDFINRVILKELFEPKDEEEKECFIKQVKNILDMFLIDYLNFITLVYGELEAYIVKYIDNKKKYTDFKKEFKEDYRNRGEVYKMIQYLVKKQDIQLSIKENKIIEFIDVEVRKKRNDLIHKILPFSKKEYAEEILRSGHITSILQRIELKHKYNKSMVLLFIKQAFNIIDNKIA
ncbi:hypothetical protein ACV30Q_13955 [Clostridium perfringens]|uniref:hypothetical protein n=1 Tax=Clostridium perfringens TaxID=1502 RepID=UPI0013D0F037|nr:hypothetical protein [Clostridium perfringens]KAF2784967.1 hypothetical protein SV13_02370 [Clostridium perfringens]MBI5992613.1 hypothetical protein [Clostridium perfringens]MDK0724930.1 hypothetical protein [Clostridium perfringens]